MFLTFFVALGVAGKLWAGGNLALKVQVIEMMEPTNGLEPLTCRLRIDPVLRMLLCDMDHT